MGKLIVSMNITLDGFIAGPDCELDWHVKNWTTNMAISLGEQLSNADTILLGRITYNAMAAYWTSKANDLSLPREDIALADMMNRYKKVVFSRTMMYPVWNNSKIINGNIRGEVLKLKEQSGRDVIIYGSATIVAKLMKLRLIDQYTLWMHPVILGKGKPLCKSLNEVLTMKLFKSETFSTGVVKLCYLAG